MNETTTPDRKDEEDDSLEDTKSLKKFLEENHASTKAKIEEFWRIDGTSLSNKRKVIITPDLRLHCRECDGERTFRCERPITYDPSVSVVALSLTYICGDCRSQKKYYYLQVKFLYKPFAEVYKYGENPPIGVPVSNRILRLFGKDGSLFLKGRQCESLGYGVGAFAYYRRVVENHKNDIFDEIIKVCKTVNAPDKVISELEQAKKEIAFTRSVEEIKSALPQGLLINGHNPLLALHGALSVGLHDGTDEECLAAAQAVRLVLADLVEKMATLKQDNRELNDAVQLLLKKKS